MINEHNYFCPYTKNSKFKYFIDDLLEINMSQENTATEIVNYVSLIETFYTDKIKQIKLKNKEFMET